MAASTTAQQIIDVVTPAAGESVTEGTILEWHVKVGDSIEVDATIVEISTDKVDVELPAPASGTVTGLLVQEGDTVTVGQVIARIAVGAESGAAPNGSSTPADGTSAPADEAPRETPTAGEAPTAGESVQEVDVVTPAAGESVTEGTILEWHAKVGDFIKADATIVEISTDKVDVELPAPAGGTVTELLVEEGAAPPAAEGGNGATHAPAPTEASADATQVPDGTKVSPVAARVAAVEGVNLAQVSGSGPAGRITKSDVLSAAAGAGSATGSNGAGSNGAATAAPEASSQPMRGGAAMLARYMQGALTIPTATSFRTLTVTTLDARRKELKGGQRKVSFTHLIAYAIALAAEDMPVMANHYAEIDGKPNRMLDGQVNLGLAVDVEKKDGSRTLMVPVIRNAGKQSFERFLDAYDELVDKARTNTLTADDLVGANVTLTNPGGLGTAASVPRLMSGQGTIVATGSIGYPV